MKAKNTRGFTLIEMLCILVVAAILAEVLIPVTLAAVHEARVNRTVESYKRLRSATVAYFRKYVNVAGVDVYPACTNGFDVNVLKSIGLIEEPFRVYVGDRAEVILAQAMRPDANVNATNAAFDLLGDGFSNATGGRVVYCVIHNVLPEEVYGLSRYIDDTLRPTNNRSAVHLEGRVKFDFRAERNVYIYVAHR